MLWLAHWIMLMVVCIRELSSRGDLRRSLIRILKSNQVRPASFVDIDAGNAALQVLDLAEH